MKKTFFKFAKTKNINKIITTSFVCAVAMCSGGFISHATKPNPSNWTSPTNSGSEKITADLSAAEKDLSKPSDPDLPQTESHPDDETNTVYELEDDDEDDDRTSKNHSPTHTSSSTVTSPAASCAASAAAASPNPDATTFASVTAYPTLTPLTLDQLPDGSLKAKLQTLQGKDTIEMIGGFLTPGEITLLFRYLMTNPHFTHLTLMNKNLNDADAKNLASVLMQNTTLTHIDISYNNISDSGTESLTQALIKNPTIVSINLHRNKIGDTGAKTLITMIRNVQRQIDVIVSENPISESNANQILNEMGHNPYYNKIALPWTIHCSNTPNVSPSTKRAQPRTKLNQMLTFSFSSITSLILSLSQRPLQAADLEVDFRNYTMTDNDIITLSESLKFERLHSVKFINLSRTGLNSVNIIPLMEALKENTTITSLDLSNNSLKNIKSITDVLNTTAITSLNLQNTEITTDTVRSLLLPVLCSKTSKVEFLDLSDNDIDYNAIKWSNIHHPMTIILSYNPGFEPKLVSKQISYRMEKNHKPILVLTISAPKK